MGDSSERSLPLNRLVKENEMLSEVEVASVVAPLLDRLSELHASGRTHGSVNLATVVIKVVGPADGTVHLPDPGSCAAHRPCAACQQIAEGQTAAADIWSVGIIALQLLLGRPCRNACSAALVNKETSDMPVLPRGTSLECIDFLMDCLAARAEDRATASELAKHAFLRTIAAPAGPRDTDGSLDALTDSLADALLISASGRQQEQACRPECVPSLKAKGRVHFTAPSHTARCLQCRCAKEGKRHAACEEADVGEAAEQVSRDRTPPVANLKLKMLPSPTTNSAASTKRKLSPRAPTNVCKRKCLDPQKPSKIAKYLSPAILPMEVVAAQQAGDLPASPPHIEV